VETGKNGSKRVVNLEILGGVVAGNLRGLFKITPSDPSGLVPLKYRGTGGYLREGGAGSPSALLGIKPRPYAFPFLVLLFRATGFKTAVKVETGFFYGRSPPSAACFFVLPDLRGNPQRRIGSKSAFPFKEKRGYRFEKSRPFFPADNEGN
jgi:hypothetical protein